MNIRESIQKIAEYWFLSEPVFFEMLYRHKITANEDISCMIRSGQGRIEYNPHLLGNMPQKYIERLLTIEMIRILLKHPYERQPDGCQPEEQKAGSDMVIAPNYQMADLIHPSVLDLPEGMNYEWYVKQIMHKREDEESGNSKYPTDSDNSNDEEIEDDESEIPLSGNGDDEEDNGNGNIGDFDSGMPGNSDISKPDGASGNGKCDSPENDEDTSESDGDPTESDEDNGESSDSEDSVRGNESDKKDNVDDGDNSDDADDGDSSDEVSDKDSKSGKIQIPQGDPKKQSASDYTGLWEEDDMQICEINETILSSTNWGSVPAEMVETIIKSTKGRIKYESILREFYASALSDNRRLTRSRPSRRFGFDQMGSFYKYMPKLIVALDCSGSVGSEELGMYLHTISQFFKYGIEGIDVITFDAAVNEKVQKLKKAKDKKIEVKGRGGTDFQPVVDYFCKHPDYDGMMIVTDGYGLVPKAPSFLKHKILWIFDNEEVNMDAFRGTGRVCKMLI